jgi:putative transposase
MGIFDDLPLSFPPRRIRVPALSEGRTMKRGRFTEEQIAVLREHEAGAKTGELARKHGISEATLYNWKAKCGGIDVSEAKRLRMLEDENRKLKKLLAESMLDKAALKASGKMYGPPGVARSFVLLSEAACVNVLAAVAAKPPCQSELSERPQKREEGVTLWVKGIGS